MAFFDIVKMILPLLLIIVLLGGVLWFVKKYSYQSRTTSNFGVDVNVLSSKMILPKKYISVVKVKDRLLVLGISESSINLLKEFEVGINQKPIPVTNENKITLSQFLEEYLRRDCYLPGTPFSDW